MNSLTVRSNNNNIEYLSNSQIILAVSNWLQQSLPAENDQQQWQETNIQTLQLQVPAVYSHEYWFDLAISPICEEIGDHLDSGQEEGPRICHLLNFAIELCGRIDNEHCRRERMVEMLSPLKHLLRCLEKPRDQQTRRMAQKSFTTLLGRFEPASQFLLISRLFQLVYTREVQLSEEIFEPQVLAFLIDIYRQKCFGNNNNECKQLFQSQLVKFYAQLSEIVYEDPLIALNFYSAVLLLISAQALHRTRISLLKDVGQSIVDKFYGQLRDWMELCRQRADRANQMACNHQSEIEQSTVEDLLERQRQKTEDDALRLSMFYLHLDETQQRMDIAFEEQEMINF